MATPIALKSLVPGTLFTFDGSKIVPGTSRQVHVYQRNTTTHVTVYQDASLTTTLTQPLTSGSDGTIPGYIAGDQAVDFVDVVTSQRLGAEAVGAVDVELVANKNQPNGYAGLDNTGKINTSQIGGTVTSVAGKTGVVTLAEGDITNLTSDLAATEKTANKGQANGYAPLDGSGKVPSGNLPSSSVTSVAGKTGAVSLVEGDIANLTTDLAGKLTQSSANSLYIHQDGTGMPSNVVIDAASTPRDLDTTNIGDANTLYFDGTTSTLKPVAGADLGGIGTVTRTGESDRNMSKGMGSRSNQATTWNETFTDLTNWTVSNTLTAPQVLKNGRLYGGNALSALQRPVNIASGSTARYVGRLHHVDPGAGAGGYMGIYLTSDQPSVISGGTLTNTALVFVDTTSGHQRQAVINVNGTAYLLGTFAAGNYDILLGVQVDEQFISFFLRSADGTQEFRGYAALTAPGGGYTGAVLSPSFALTYAGVFVYDARGTAGSSFGPVGFRNSLAPVEPRTNLEDFTESQIVRENPIQQGNRISLPKTYDPAVPTPLVLYCHGGNAIYTDIQDNPNIQPVNQALLNAGCIVASSQAHGNAFGNQTSLDDLYALYKWCTQHYNIGQVIVMAFSMGGLLGLMSIADKRIPVDGFMGFSPVTNLLNVGTSIVNPSSPLHSYLTDFQNAFGLPNNFTPTQYNTATAGHDPNLFPSHMFRDVPLYLAASPDDTLLDWTQNAQLLYNRLHASGFNVTFQQTSGEHATITQFPTSAVTGWLAGILRSPGTANSTTRTTALEAATSVSAQKDLHLKLKANRVVFLGHSGIEPNGSLHPFTWPSKLARTLGAEELNYALGGTTFSLDDTTEWPFGVNCGFATALNSVYPQLPTLANAVTGDLMPQRQMRNTSQLPPNGSASYEPLADLYCIFAGAEDMLATNANPALAAAIVSNVIEGVIARCRSGAIFNDDDSAFQYSANWTAVAHNTRPNFATMGSGHTTTTTNTTITLTVPASYDGGEIAWNFILGRQYGGLITFTGTNLTNPDGSGGSITLNMNGTSGRCPLPGDHSNAGTLATRRMRLPVTGSTQTIVATVTSFAGTNPTNNTGGTTNITTAWFDSATIEATDPPRVLVFTHPHGLANVSPTSNANAGYAGSNPVPRANLTNADFDILNTQLKTLPAKWADGLVMICDTQQRYAQLGIDTLDYGNPNSPLYADHAHPNERGNAVIAQLALDTLAAGPRPRTQLSSTAPIYRQVWKQGTVSLSGNTVTAAYGAYPWGSEPFLWNGWTIPAPYTFPDNGTLNLPYVLPNHGGINGATYKMQGLEYCKDAAGRVTIRGLVKASTASPGLSPIMMLPTAYWPAEIVGPFLGITQGTISLFQPFSPLSLLMVTPDGWLVHWSSTGDASTWLSMNFSYMSEGGYDL